jgi:hypothetical protein
MNRAERQNQFLRIDRWLDRFHRENPWGFDLFAVAIAASLFLLGWWAA